MERQEPNWDLYRTFLAVIRDGNFSAAARRLGLAQPTVGRQIEALEATLKSPLFTRSQRGLLPTAAARELIPLGHVDPFTTMLRCPNYLFLARGLSATERAPEEAESNMELRRMPFQRAYELALSGEITHGSSCVAIFRAAEWLRAH